MNSIFPLVAPDGVSDRDYMATLAAKHYDKIVPKDSPDRCGIEGCASQAVPELSDFPVCSYHFNKIIKRHRAKDIEREAAEEAKKKAMHARWAERDEQRQSWLRGREQVYYVHTSPKTIKIGFTAAIIDRMQQYRLPLTHLLATEPGGRDVEKMRHDQFGEYRYGRREDFIDAPELREHIQLMRETHDTILTDRNHRHGEPMIIPKLVATTDPVA